MLIIVNANYQGEYKIFLQFNDKKEDVVDLKDFIINGNIKPFKQLENLDKFKNFQVDYTIK